MYKQNNIQNDTQSNCPPPIDVQLVPKQQMLTQPAQPAPHCSARIFFFFFLDDCMMLHNMEYAFGQCRPAF